MIYSTDFEAFSKRITDWGFNENASYVKLFVAIMVINALNFGLTLFEYFMLEKMSQARWS